MAIELLYCFIIILIIFVILHIYIKRCNKDVEHPNIDKTVDNDNISTQSEKNNNIISELINNINNKQNMFFNKDQNEYS